MKGRDESREGDGGTRPSGSAWYRRWFGEDYLSVYPHRDDREAERAVELLQDVLNLRPRSLVLDLACGEGRHLAVMRARGLQPVGLDLSPELLRRAREREDASRRLVRGDMRIVPFRAGAFDATVLFFTSFGYFESRQEDRTVLAEVRRTLRPGGSCLLDYLNAERVRRRLVSSEVGEVEGRRVRQERWIEDDRVVKRIEIGEEGEDGFRVYHERVRLYGREELETMMADSGLEVDRRFGDYDGSGFTEDSPRLILAGRRT